MALFKINKGAETNLPTTKTEGWAYFCTDTGNFWIDHKNESDTLVRSKISAEFADKLRYVKDGDIIEIFPEEIALKSEVIQTVTTTGSATTYMATVPGITELTAGVNFIMVPHITSASKTPTINVNNLGVKYLTRRLSSIATGSQEGYSETWLLEGVPIWVIYDGANWIVESQTKPSVADLYGLVTEITNDASDGTVATEKAVYDFVMLNIDTKIQSMLVTTAEYETLEANNELQENVLYMLTDDTSEEDLTASVNDMNNIDYENELAFDTTQIVSST